MSIAYHPDDSTLMSYAAGSLPAALAIVVACHLAVCPRCPGEVETLELLGGALLAGLRGAGLRRSGPEAGVPAPKLAPRPPLQPAPGADGGSGEVPPPLAHLAVSGLDAVRWRWIARGFWLRRLPIAGAGRLHLIKGAADVALPRHGHVGSEITMVLRGTLLDAAGRYRPGDVCDLDENVEHRPAAGADGCICLMAQERPARFGNLGARLARPWHGL